MKNLTISLFAALLTCMATLADAGQLATLGIINQNTGERLNIWRHEGRNYVAGNPGDRYSVALTNRTGARVLAVVSVDGVNVISGATASADQTGYVIDASQSLEIKGWRKSMDEVAAFYFTRLPDSYAARTGRPDNVGVIGVALFREYVEPLAKEESLMGNSVARKSAQGNSPAASPAAPMASDGASKRRAEEVGDNAKIGTGHGERLISETSVTEFRRASAQAAEMISIYYDTYAHLVARGIIPRSQQHEPVPFPGNFTPDPS